MKYDIFMRKSGETNEKDFVKIGETIPEIIISGIRLISNKYVNEYTIKSIKNNIFRRFFTGKKYRTIKEMYIYRLGDMFLCNPKTYKKILEIIEKRDKEKVK